MFVGAVGKRGRANDRGSGSAADDRQVNRLDTRGQGNRQKGALSSFPLWRWAMEVGREGGVQIKLTTHTDTATRATRRYLLRIKKKKHVQYLNLFFFNASFIQWISREC